MHVLHISMHFIIFFHQAGGIRFLGFWWGTQKDGVIFKGGKPIYEETMLCQCVTDFPWCTKC